MKNSLKNLNLWQKKRNELPISDEPQKDWLEMQNLLDLHLPVTHTAVPKKVSGSKGLKVIKALKAIKGSSMIFISLATITCIGIVTYAVKIKHQQQTQPHHKIHRPIITKDSLSNPIIVDSLNLTDSIHHEKDSLPALKAPLTGRDTDVTIQKTTGATGKNNINNPVPLINNAQRGNNAQQTIGNRKGKKSQNFIVNNNQKAAQGSAITNVPSNNSNPFSLQGINKNSPLNIINSLGTSQSNGNIIATTQSATNGKNVQSLLTGVDSTQRSHNESVIQPSLKPTSSSGATTRKNAANTKGNTIRTQTNKPASDRQKGSSKVKKTRVKTSNNLPPSNLDWGILAGVSSSGSFTAKSQNANIYGKLPVDIYIGLFATYHLNDKWAINSQIRVLNPQNLNSSFTHFVNENKADSGKVLAITDSRKAYFVSIPIHLVYKINNNISVKGGPVINIPVKQITNSTTLQSGIKLDSAYNITVSNQLKAIKYDQKINLGLSGGVSLQYKRLILEATYLKSFSGYNVISDFGNYKSNTGTVQVTLGLQLNRIKL
ncbi:MAG: outer membrane protein beta-barrel protein [Mucilaginibacter sp.]|nr:outer membrane protein beta-barrel protein [Mucilaginibacter sp.]